MNIAQLEQELETNFETISKAGGELQNFEILYNLYAQTETAQLAKSGADGVALETISDQLGEAQDNLINLSTKLTATTLEDILFKMALWRRHAAQIDPFDGAMTGDEKLGYSVFMDLALMCQRDDVFTDCDTKYLLSR